MKTPSITNKIHVPQLAFIEASKPNELPFYQKVALTTYAYKAIEAELDKGQAENFLGLCNKTVATAVRLNLSLPKS